MPRNLYGRLAAFAWVLALLLGLLAVLPKAHAQPRCERFTLNSPAAGATLQTRYPELRWSAEPNTTFRVQIVVLIPEGRIVESVDTTIQEPHWTLNTPMAHGLLVVKALVTRHCEHYTVQDLLAEPPSFFISAWSQCAILAPSLIQSGGQLRWQAEGGADKYAVTLFKAKPATGTAIDEMVRLERYETSTPQWDLAALSRSAGQSANGAQNTYVATVQAQCGGVWSQPVATVLKAP